MFYATKDSSEGKIEENAKILAFNSIEEARQYIISDFGDEWDISQAQISPGRFGDYWFSAHKDIQESYDLGPFTPDQILSQKPGTHPGGNRFWFEPKEPVYVLAGGVFEKEDDE